MSNDKHASQEIGSRIADGLASSIRYDITRLMNEIDSYPHCESPIELMLCTALVMALSLRGYWFICCPQQAMDHIFFKDTNRTKIMIVPQYRFKKYRIDLAWINRQIEKMFFIECDGHEFHERTKEQAKQDRSRDRECQKNGIPIIRFTGSEIWEDPVGCAVQIIEFGKAIID